MSILTQQHQRLVNELYEDLGMTWALYVSKLHAITLEFYQRNRKYLEVQDLTLNDLKLVDTRKVPAKSKR